MKIEDIKIGMRVTPHSKNPIRRGNCGLNTSICWKKAIEQGRPWLYVTEIVDDGECMLDLSPSSESGDFFHVSDFVKDIKYERYEKIKQLK